MAIDVRLVIVDASPLITLAAAGSLDYLLYPGIPLVIPDAVFFEAAADRLGAQEILDWYRSHTDKVRVEPTETLRNALLLPRIPRDLGEQAALEVVRETTFLDRPGNRALILSDDRDAERLLAPEASRVIVMTTWDYLQCLEDAQRIQSADATLQAVEALGRNAPRRSVWDKHHPDIRDAVRAIVDPPVTPKS